MVLIVLALATGGCAAPPVHIADYHRGQSPQFYPAPTADVYTLLANQHDRIQSTTFNVGDAVGFTRRNGVLLAVAADERIVLPEGNYSWIAEPPAPEACVPVHQKYHPTPLEPETGTNAVSTFISEGLRWLGAGAPDVP
jgi:hypothetical protein